MSQTVPCFCPKKFIADEGGTKFNNLLTTLFGLTSLWDVSDEYAFLKDPILFEENRPLHTITSQKLYEMMGNSVDQDIVDLYQKYSEDEIRILPVSWLEIEGYERFLAKQLSQYISKNAPKHRAFFNKINWTEENCEQWVAFVLQERWQTTIHAFQQHAQDAIRLQYEIAIPLEDLNSIGCQEGC